MATTSSKSFAQLPALLFSIFFILTGARAWSADHITTYEAISGNGDLYRTWVITERSRDGSHLFLTDFRLPNGQQEVGGVMRQVPASDQFGSHQEEYHPSTINATPDEEYQGGPGSLFLGYVTPASYEVLLGEPPLTELSDEDRNRMVLSLPIPVINIPVGNQTMDVNGEIRRPNLIRLGDSILTVSGFGYGVLPGPESLEIGVEAEFTYNSADRSVRLVRFQIGDFMTVRHISTEESNVENELMEYYWNQLEKYQIRAEKLKIRRECQYKYLDSLKGTDRALFSRNLAGLIIRSEDAERTMQLRRDFEDFCDDPYDEHAYTEILGAGGDANEELEPDTTRNASSYNTLEPQSGESSEEDLRTPPLPPLGFVDILKQ